MFKILSTASALPKCRKTNDDLSIFLDTSDEWISQRTGIRERAVCTDETLTDLLTQAANQALERAGITAQELDLILCATIRGDYITPSQACVIPVSYTHLKVRYMHHDIDTIERMEIIRDLRLGEFDVLVGINLLREGLDIPEVSLVAILDADKEGFLRSETSLIQTIGRAARNANGKVIMYADSVTDSMERAISETYRRREVQLK